MESHVLWHMPVCGVYISVPYVHNSESARTFLRTQFKGNGHLGKYAVEVTRLVNDKENDCIFEVQREEHCIHTQPTWLIAVRER